MINLDPSNKPTTQAGNVIESAAEQATTAVTQQSWPHRIWLAIRNYPVPLSALVLLLVSLVLWLVGRTDLANWTLLVIVLMGGIPLLWDTLKHIIHREFSVDFIAILAITGSLLLQEYLAGAFIVLMLSGGEALEAFALRRARTSLSALAERAPRTAHIWQGDQLTSIPAEAVEVDMVIVVKPGELIPVDGIVTSGSSSISEADLTGEPMPVRKNPGMLVLSGSVNLDGVLEVRASKRSADSKYAQIVHLVEEAQKQKAPIHRLADRYAVGFSIAAIALAGLSWAISQDSVFALAVLVVATPCPLILATPIAIMSGIDLAARNGIIAKSGAAIEQLGEVDVAVFDKTGTLTLGIPKVTAIVLPEPENQYNVGAGLAPPVHLTLTPARAPDSADPSEPSDPPGWSETFTTAYNQNTLLRFAASVEQLSTHILARAVVDAALEHDLPLSPATDFEETFGKGVQARVPIISEDCQVERRGVNDVVAHQIGELAQVDRVVSRCLPDDKLRIIQELEAQGHHVLMVGDGINDAPALAIATVGMALGSQGLTAAATAADTVLLSTDILRVVRAIRLGRCVMRVALQGIWVGMGLSGIAMLFAAFGLITPAAGAILQEGIDVIVILNALRVSRIKL